MANCIYCNQPISFVKRKGLKSIPVQTKAEYFIPESGGSETYVTTDGKFQSGRPATDGRKGYRLHNCERG